MITKRTDELRPGDRVRTTYGERAVRGVTGPRPGHRWYSVLWKMGSLPGPKGEWAEAEDEWQVVEPSKLDLAVQRAQELATAYDHVSPSVNDALRDYGLLLDLFRAAR